MRKLVSLTLAILMILSVVPLSVLSVGAETVTSGVVENITWTLDGTKLTISGNGNMPSFYYTSVPWPTTITEVVIEEGVTSITNRVFRYCYDIKDLTIPKSMKIINGLYYCNIERLHIPNIETWLEMTYIYYDVFSSVENLYCNGELIKDLVLPEGVKKISDNAFNGYNKLESVTFTTLPVTVGEDAFFDCENLKDVYIDDLYGWVTSDFKGAERYFDSASGDYVGGIAFSNPLYNADNLFLKGELVSGEITIPNSLTEIGQGVFCGYDKITKVIIPDSVKRIDYGAFQFCQNLKEVYLGKNVLTIGKRAFYDCKELKKITVHNKLWAIGSEVFSGCTSLSDVWYKGVKDEANKIQYQYGDGYSTNALFRKATWHYIKDKTLAKVGNTWYLYENNKKSQKSELVKYEGKWFFVLFGIWYSKYTGVIEHKNVLFYIKNGRWKQNYNGMAKYNGYCYYFKNGKASQEKNGFVTYDGRVYYIKDGKQVKESQILKYKGKEYFFKNGVKSTYTGLLRHNGKWYYLKKGAWYKGKAIVRYVPKKVEIKKGVYIYSYYLADYKGELFYVNNGYAQLNFSGKVTVGGKTYNIKNGIVV